MFGHVKRAGYLLSCLAGIVSTGAFAAASGLDTPTGTTIMPFSIQGAETMDLTSSGLGIGTNNPGYPLDVETGSTTAIYGSTAANGGWGGFFHNNDSGGNRYVQLAGGAYAAIFMNGNVGIATTGPTQALDVNGYVRIRSINGEGGAIQMDGNNGVTTYIENYNGTLRLINSQWTADIFHVDQSGNVNVVGNLTANAAICLGGVCKSSWPGGINFSACAYSSSASGGWAPVGGYHYAMCPANSVMVGMRFIGGDGTNSTSGYNFQAYCCPVS